MSEAAARVTAADINGRKTTSAAHLNMGGAGGGWMYGIEGLPRLQVFDFYNKRARKSTRTWNVDGKACRDLDDALAVINGEMSMEEAVKRAGESQPPAQEKKQKFSLQAQIEEIDRELGQRAKVYPRLVSSGQLRESMANYQVDRLKAVRATLVWLLEREDFIKQRMSY